jgi:hypothetical protein
MNVLFVLTSLAVGVQVKKVSFLGGRICRLIIMLWPTKGRCNYFFSPKNGQPPSTQKASQMHKQRQPNVIMQCRLTQNWYTKLAAVNTEDFDAFFFYPGVWPHVGPL